MALFHLAINVVDLASTRNFYGGPLGCGEGRSTQTWVDFDFFGHQLSCHLGEPFQTARTGYVGDMAVPMPHFGAVLPMKQWQNVAARLEGHVEFILAPQIRFAGQPGEQAILFIQDPSGNPIELKGMQSLAKAFET